MIRSYKGLTLAAVAVAGLLATGADAQTSQNVIFHSNLDEYGTYNDIWGYTAPNGDEYALLGITTGVSVINVTDPANPYETGYLPGATSTWRDIKTYQSYAYVTNESSGGLQIIDLTDPENPLDLPNYTGFGSAHNLYIDESTGLLYTAGANVGSGGTRILSLANPTNPVEIASWETRYFHDVMVQNGRLYGSAINNAQLYVLDVSNPTVSIPTLATKGGYPNAFTHNAWVTADDAYVMTTDETSGAASRMWDLSNLSNLVETDNYNPNGVAIPHNTHIDGDLAIISHYTLGVRIVDISNKNNLQEVGYYDSWPADDGSSFNGCWGAFPFFGTTPGLIVISDISTGLYVLEYKGPLGTIAGTVTESGNPGVLIADADVQIVETGVSTATDAVGDYSIQDTAGAVNVQVSAFAYQTATVPVTNTVGTTTVLDIQLTPVAGSPVAGTVSDANTSVGLDNATVEIISTPLSQMTAGGGAYSYGSVPAGSYTFRAKAFGYNVLEKTVTVPVGGSLTVDFDLNPASVVADDYESGVGGWAVTGNATTGQWELGDPQPTDGGNYQTGDDHTPAPGVNAWITELAAGSGIGSFDVDNGTTTLTSPVFSVLGLTDPHVSYYRWYQTGGGGNSTSDFWVAEISSNAGGSWTVMDTTDKGQIGWVEIDRSISSLVTPTAQMQFRFTAQDTGAGSLTEAGLDDFMIYDVETDAGAVDAPNVAPTAARTLELSPAAPNPFLAGSMTSLSFSLPQSGPIRAEVFDISGRRIMTLADGVFEAGAYRLDWDGTTSAGGLASTGVYFVRLSTEAGNRSQKMVLMR